MQKLRIQMLLLQENVPTRVEAAQCLFCKKDKLLLALNCQCLTKSKVTVTTYNSQASRQH